MALTNEFGKSIQISNHPDFYTLNKKNDYVIGENYNSVMVAVDAISNTIISEIDGSKMDRITLLTHIYFLGKIDGGKNIINQINSRLPEEMRISEYEIAYLRLQNIFGEDSDIFEMENISEIEKLFNSDTTNLDTTIIKYAYTLSYICEYYRANNQLTDKNYAEFVMQEALKYAERYKQTRDLSISPEYLNILNTIEHKEISIDERYQEVLNDSIEAYNNNAKGKEHLLHSLMEYSPEYKGRSK